MSDVSIHPSALVDKDARLGDGVSVGPFSVIGSEVEVGEGTEIGAHVVLEGPLHIGRNNHIFPFVAIGQIPQDLKYHGERSEIIIGDDNRIREFVTIHRGTEGGGSLTRIGSGNLIMAYSHIAHDCQLGDGIIMGNGATLAGHVKIDDHAVVGAFCGVHQFCRIGTHAFIGGYTVITQDVIPFARTIHERGAKTYGPNLVGLERKGISAECAGRIGDALKILTRSKKNTSQAIEEIRAKYSGDEDVEKLVSFVETSERGVIK